MIKRPEEMDFSDKRFSVILYGPPGLGKTTLALSAPDPILIDFDRGLSRVRAQHRKPAIMADSYDEVLRDIESPEVKECQTLVIDTGGSLITYLQDWAMRNNPAVNRQKNGALSLKGFGAVKSEFIRFTGYARDVLNKNIIYVFHSEEQKDKDGNPQQRLLCEGAARNLVWQPCDLGGYMQMIGNERTISFAPTQEFFAKGCYGISGTMRVPDVSDPSTTNDFLTKLFDKARAAISAEADAYAPQREKYAEAMAAVQEILSEVCDADSATAAVWRIQRDVDHALTSKTEARAMLLKVTDALGLKWNKETGRYEGDDHADADA